MPNLLDHFNKKEPRYPTRFRDLIDKLSRRRACDTSVGTEEEKFAQGKIFANYYECFLYATILGIRQGQRIPLDRQTDGTKFLNVEGWRPRPLVEYVFTALLALSDIELIDLEEMDDKQTDDAALKLVHLMEEYAYGGFDLLQSRLADEPHLLENPYGAVGLLKGLGIIQLN